MSFRAIAARTGASAATVSRRARAGGWLRPDTGFPIEHYSAEGRRTLRRRALAEQILTQAEHAFNRLALDPQARGARLAHAMRLVRAARALDQAEHPGPRRRKRRRAPAFPRMPDSP